MVIIIQIFTENEKLYLGKDLNMGFQDPILPLNHLVIWIKAVSHATISLFILLPHLLPRQRIFVFPLMSQYYVAIILLRDSLIIGHVTASWRNFHLVF